MVFNSCNKNYTFDIYINGQRIKQANHVKFLGVYIDSNLSWENHILHVCNQVSKGVGILCRLKHISPRLILRKIYLTLILPHLSYCCIVWSGTTNRHLNKLIVLQKRALRHIYSAGPRDQTNKLFKSLNLLKLSDIIRLSISIFTYRFFCKRFAIFFLRFLREKLFIPLIQH
ncbi:RNA-directed DNA polymerase from mobile element jockey [Holothuria leucospilota]|uniref:RNA-directed DNA polymerase from mobile element jockey n=1 Tax=Holothuria leucospilota TaxID=206669 RepID=A0A9Q1CNB8_HOLLE|nr:RNA-directed DNA polymerase from mobile element jockey [Holothuria leucospilota]